MTLTNNRLTLIVVFIFIALEAAVAILSYMEILAIGYGWDGRWSLYALVTIIGIQLIVLYFISQTPDPKNKTTLYLAQIIVAVVVAIWLVAKTEIHYMMI